MKNVRAVATAVNTSSISPPSGSHGSCSSAAGAPVPTTASSIANLKSATPCVTRYRIAATDAKCISRYAPTAATSRSVAPIALCAPRAHRVMRRRAWTRFQ